MSIDPQDLAKSELAKAMIPTPDDIMTELSPIASLYYLEQLGWAVLNNWTAYAQDQKALDKDGADDLGLTVQGIAETVGMLDGVCARISLIPTEAVPPK